MLNEKIMKKTILNILILLFFIPLIYAADNDSEQENLDLDLLNEHRTLMSLASGQSLLFAQKFLWFYVSTNPSVASNSANDFE